MATVLAGVALLSIAIAGGYGLYRYFTRSTVDTVSMPETSDELEHKADGTADTSVTDVPWNFSEELATPAEDTKQLATDVISEEKPSLSGVSQAPRGHPCPADDRPTVAPKPKFKSTKEFTSPKPPIVGLGSNSVPFPMAFSDELRAKLKDKNKSKFRVEENGPVKALTCRNEEITECGTSFEEPTKTPTLRSPSRNKGPSNRRRPTQH